MPFRQFIDVSRYQTLTASIYAASTGAVWAPLIIVNFDGNPSAVQQWEAAGKAGLTRGAYCFATPGEDGAADVDRMLGFLTQAGGWGPADFPVLDVETSGGTGWAAAYTASACVEAASRWRPGWLYVGGPFARAESIVWPGGGWRHWAVAYPGPPQKPAPSWPDPVAHQYTGQGSAPGVGGQVDVSWLFDESVLHPATPSVNPTPVGQEDAVARFIAVKGSGSVQVADGISWRHVGSPDEMKDLVGARLVPDMTIFPVTPGTLGALTPAKGAAGVARRVSAEAAPFVGLPEWEWIKP